MNIDDIKQLAELSRLSFTDEEIAQYSKEFEGILHYIDSLKDVDVLENESSSINKNVVRDDTEAYESGEFSEVLLNEAPQKQDDYIKVKKII